MKAVRIAVLQGDGVGPEVVGATVSVLGPAQEWLRDRGIDLRLIDLPVGLTALAAQGSTLPGETFDAVREADGTILGPVMNHRYDLTKPGVVNPSRELRKRLDLFANIRPIRSYPQLGRGSAGIDLVVVRENTEGFYADRNVLDGNGELRPDEGTVISVRVVTKAASLRIVKAAYDLARARAVQRRVTAAHKANVLRLGCGLFLKARDEVAIDYPDIVSDDAHIDALAMRLVMAPQQFDVIVTTNLFGDVLSDLTAGLVGGLGLAPGLNVGQNNAVAQAVHGAAPDIAGKGIANPVAEILSSAMLFDWLARRHQATDLGVVAAEVRAAVDEALSSPDSRTPDLGGKALTAEVGLGIRQLLADRLRMRS